MSDYIVSDDQISVALSLPTAYTDSTSLSKLQYLSTYSLDVNSNDELQKLIKDGYASFNWGRLPGYIRPDQKMERRGWYWEHSYNIQKGTDLTARFWLCHVCHTSQPSKQRIFTSRGVNNIKKHL